MTTNPQHLAALRAELKNRDLAGFIVPLTDEHMSEYVGNYAQRLAWVSGFTGSAGNGVVLAEKASVFIDGRYTIQVAAEVDTAHMEHHHFEQYPLLSWVKDNSKAGDRIGYDPELATVAWEEDARAALDGTGVELVAVDTNPIDSVWEDQPDPSLELVYGHDTEYTGKTASEKRVDVAAELAKKGTDAAVITMLDSVAWAFNIRSKDVLNTPVPHAFAIMEKNELATLFVDERKVDSNLKQFLGNNVRIEPRTAFYGELEKLGSEGKTVLVDRASNNAKVFSTLKASGAKLVEGQDPCILPKAVKNATEAQGSRDAHIRDGAAIAEFLCWLEGEAPKGTVDELSAVDKLWEFRQRRDMLKDSSFDTISGAGPNGALCHYRVSEETNRKLEMNSIYLVDSGGQYLDGTTDITRTVIVGTPTDEMKDRFTRVLKGHIGLTLTRFPEGTAGMMLDSIARRPLWEAGLDYDHGTGHGVGSFLAVHEGPQRIAKFGSPVPLQAGMILSNEPGYYKEGEYGIRIENLVLVKEMDLGGDPQRRMFGFENLTWAPIERRLVDANLLDDIELNWLNAYHADVWEKLNGLVDAETRIWLEKACAPIER
ncbi:aminopeptidase P family protein [Kordiimonas laminariae]|uniref:aminopeptidase P family protein n=1 Tax=Kordiimonas laminariae TaxID=2917717 RepID=UPI001FF0E44E|nr:aminopeptidase P family protein [Kordiimonas laminariae]MCK0070796.1 aminopeptidase P family protein [Kordiimonas laminariae]